MPIEFEKDGPVATIIIDGYNELNPITYEMYRGLYERFVEFDEDPQLRVAILRGAGDRHFSAGGNLKVFGPAADRLTVEARALGFWYPASFNLQGRSIVYEHRAVKPVIGEFRGYCLGAGLILSGLRTSLRIAGESARFGLSEVKLGLGGSASIKSGLAHQLPYAALMWLVATGEMIDAATALRIGLINEIVPDNSVSARVQELAHRIAEMPPISLRAEKEALMHTERVSFREAVAMALTVEAVNRLGPDAAEGAAAHVEERTPVFQGLRP